MPSTEENQTETAITVVATTVPPVPSLPVNNGPGIKRHFQFYRYGAFSNTKLQPLKRLLGKKCWKEVNAILNDDSTLKIFDDGGKFSNPIFEMKLENVALYLAFGKASNKYGPPPITNEENNFIDPNNFFAIPETKERDKIQWFAFKDECQSKDIIHAIAETVDGKVNPPPLGKGSQNRYALNNHESKWKTYWITCAQQQNMNTENQQFMDTENHHTGESKKYAMTPLVAVHEQKKAEEKQKEEAEKKLASPPPPPPPVSTKNGGTSTKTKPIVHPRQPHNYYNIDFEMPEKIESLHFDSNHDLCEDMNLDEEKSFVVRLVNGKRVKETIVTPKKQPIEKESSPTPPTYPPPPIPIPVIVLEEMKQHSEPKIGLREEIEIATLMKDEPRLISMKNLNEEISNPIEEENIEIVTSQANILINTANVEHTVGLINNTEYVVTCTTTKENTFQQTNTNGIGTVH